MAHSFIQAHDGETEAFEHFALTQKDGVVFLLDTYDTETAAEKVVALVPYLRKKGVHVSGVRLDSGDLADHARKVRRILDEGGLNHVRIYASGNLDEYIIQELVSGAPIDGFGVGSRLDTSADAPYLDCAYKLQEYQGRPRRKRSEGKATWPGRKQVYRVLGYDGRMAYDTLTLEDDPQEGQPLIQPFMRAGKRLGTPSPLSELRKRATAQLAFLPEHLRKLKEGPPYEVRIRKSLRDLAARVDAQTSGV
jgi:nicotinate phosphoribosyltransferase